MGLLILLCGQARADNTSLTVTISGTIMANACQVNQGQAITVDFGTVRVSDLASTKKTIPLTITCDEAPSGTVSFEVKGAASAFDARALATDTAGLGVNLSYVSQAGYGFLDLNTFYDVSKTFGLTSKTGSFDLTAGLTSDGTTAFAGGDFNATATLVMKIS